MVSDAATKSTIRVAAEAEEHKFYECRATDEWRNALASLGTDANKPFLETVPYLIAVFYEAHGLSVDGKKEKRDHPVDLTGIACGLLS